MKNLQFDFSNRNFIITGASSGMGKQVALELAQAGANVLAVARREELLLDLQKKNANIVVAPLDVCDYVAMEKAINDFVSAKGKIHGAVYAAGKTDISILRKYDETAMRQLMDINFWAGAKFMQLCSYKTNSVDGASLVWFSSVGAEYPADGLFAYSGAKAAVQVAVKAVSKELSRRKLRINSISPGYVDTPMVNQYEWVDSIKHFINNTYLGIGKPEDVSGMVLFLLSDRASWITGANFPVNGGFGV